MTQLAKNFYTKRFCTSDRNATFVVLLDSLFSFLDGMLCCLDYVAVDIVSKTFQTCCFTIQTVSEAGLDKIFCLGLQMIEYKIN